MKSLRSRECKPTASGHMMKQRQGDSHLGTPYRAVHCLTKRGDLVYILHGAQVCIHFLPDFENATQQRPSWVVGNWWIPAEFEQWDLTEHLRKKKDGEDGEDRQNTIVQTKSELKKKKKLATTNIPQLSNLDQNENLDNVKVCQ